MRLPASILGMGNTRNRPKVKQLTSGGGQPTAGCRRSLKTLGLPWGPFLCFSGREASISRKPLNRKKASGPRAKPQGLKAGGAGSVGSGRRLWVPAPSPVSPPRRAALEAPQLRTPQARGAPSLSGCAPAPGPPLAPHHPAPQPLSRGPRPRPRARSPASPSAPASPPDARTTRAPRAAVQQRKLPAPRGRYGDAQPYGGPQAPSRAEGAQSRGARGVWCACARGTHPDSSGPPGAAAPQRWRAARDLLCRAVGDTHRGGAFRTKGTCVPRPGVS